MSSFKQIQVLKQPKPGQNLSENTLYWKDYEVKHVHLAIFLNFPLIFLFACVCLFYQFPTTISEYGGINSIDVSVVKPYYVAASHSSRV
jgi:hypothetical protein